MNLRGWLGDNRAPLPLLGDWPVFKTWSQTGDSNAAPFDYEPKALPTELVWDVQFVVSLAPGRRWMVGGAAMILALTLDVILDGQD